jgi:hypothetical protein
MGTAGISKTRQHMLGESRFHSLIDDNRFVQQSGQDVVILDAVLELLHEANRIALDDWPVLSVRLVVT